MKATEQYFPVMLFIMMDKVVLLLSLWIKSSSVAIQVKAIKPYIPVVLFVIQYFVKRNLAYFFSFQLGQFPMWSLEVKQIPMLHVKGE